MKKPIWLKISEKNISSAGARTHENETRPEKICVHHDWAWRKFSHLDVTLVKIWDQVNSNLVNMIFSQNQK
jgi:hypothetical protein